MIGTFVTVAFLTLKNRIVQRVRRLREPRYLIGALAGAAYFWFMIFRRAHGSNGRLLLKTFAISPVIGDVASVVVLLLMIAAWALPGDSGGLEFSEAEIAFLFSAPLRRRDLLLYKVLRSQPQALFSALVMTVMGWGRQGLFIGVWATISSLSIYFTLVSLGRARLRLAHIGFMARLVAVAAILCGLYWLALSQTGKISLSGLKGSAVLKALNEPFQKPLIRTILFIPHLFASSAMPTSLTMLAISSLSVIALGVLFFYIAAAINVSFEEASIGASQKRAARTRHIAGRGRGTEVVFRRAPAPFVLRETGPAEVAIIWKNLIALMRNSVAWVVVFIAMIVFMTGIALWTHEPFAFLMAGTLLLGVAALFPLSAPAIFTNDLRLDMTRLDVLKSYPLAGDRLVAAEIAAPLCVIAILEMLFASIGSVMIGLSGSVTQFPRYVATPQFIVTVLLLTIPVCAVQLLIRNALPVLFPAWTMRSKDEPRGFVMMGQRIVTLAGNIIVLAVALLPAAVIFLPSLWIAYKFFSGNAAFVAVATMPAVGVLAAEVWFGIKALGAQFEMIDVSNETEISVL